MQLERESRNCRDSILVMHGEKQLHNYLTWRGTLWFSTAITDVLTHRIRHCTDTVYKTFPVINYVFLVCWIGLLYHITQTAPEFVFNRVRLLCSYMPKRMNWTMGENAPGSETNSPNKPGVKTPLDLGNCVTHMCSPLDHSTNDKGFNSQIFSHFKV